jgi:hypothetical protein
MRHDIGRDLPARGSGQPNAGRRVINRQPDFESDSQPEEKTMIERTKPDETKITANLPTATIEMVMREHQDAGSEVLTVSIRATPSFQAVSQAFRPEALMLANSFTLWPFTLWMKMATLAWQPWLQLAGAGLQDQRELPKPDASSR